MYVCFVYRPGFHFFARSSCARFGSEPDKRNASVRRGPGGFFKIHFPHFFEHFLFVSRLIKLIIFLQKPTFVVLIHFYFPITSILMRHIVPRNYLPVNILQIYDYRHMYKNFVNPKIKTIDETTIKAIIVGLRPISLAVKAKNK